MGNTGIVGSEGSFWQLAALSDRELVDGLHRRVGSSRQLLAELVAHLGEVEERRLHLAGAFSSMFDYCVRRLGLSEDEACRRIEVARLARRFPVLYPMLASGQLSLSVAGSLKEYLSEGNGAELLAAVSGKSVREAREALAARFPRPDVPASVRKLPERRAPQHSAQLQPPQLQPQPSQPQPSQPQPSQPQPSQPQPSLAAQPHGLPVPDVERAPVKLSTRTEAEPPASVSAIAGAQPFGPLGASPLPRGVGASSRAAPIEPLSVGRYKVTFTADAELKTKLELARDLLRHAVPSGDYAAIVGRALDLLIENVKKRRFGSNETKAQPRRQTAPSPRPSTRSARCEVLERKETPEQRRRPASSARREVVERDGLQCSWLDEHGTRCEARAWLEHDHRHPLGKGGSSDPKNLRLLCRKHNRYAAEHEYGKAHVERAIERSRRERRHPPAADYPAGTDGGRGG
jgi:hypothetical protein